MPAGRRSAATVRSRRPVRPAPAIGLAAALATAGAAMAAGVGGGADSPPRERLEIVDRAIGHHGGDRYVASETRLTLCSKSGCSQIRALTDGWDFDLEVTAPVGEIRRRVRITNETVEQWNDGEPVAVPPDRSQALRDWVMARVYFVFLPYRLNDPGVRKQDLGLEEWRGRQLRRVRVTFVPGSSTDADDEFLFWFDPVSARLEQFAYSFHRGDGGLRFRRGFNYRRVGEILFFDQENLGVDGAGWRVDDIDPQFVARQMRPVSTVELRDVEVRPLGE